MPIYEYRCAKCTNVVERMKKYEDVEKPLEENCGCGHTPLDFIMSSSNLVCPISMGRVKLDAGATEVMKRIHKNAGTKWKTNFSTTASR